MDTNRIELEGTLQPDGTLLLDERPNLPPGRVHVIVQATELRADVIEVLRRIHEEQKARGVVPRTREEIDAEIAAGRQEDDERMVEIERVHEECQRLRQQR